MRHEKTSGFLDRPQNSIPVERIDGAKIENLGTDTMFIYKLVGDAECVVHGCAPRDYTQVCSLATEAGLSKGDNMARGRTWCFSEELVVEEFILNIHCHTTASQRHAHQSYCVV